MPTSNFQMFKINLQQCIIGGIPTLISDAEDSCVRGNIQHDINCGKFDLKHLGEGFLFIDVGANIGMVSIEVERRTGWDVIAIEPNPFNYARLVENIIRSGEQILPLSFAVLPSREPGRMIIGSGNTGGATFWSSMCRSELPSGHVGTMVPSVTLDYIFDTYSNGRKVVLKVDVEGSEHFIFDNFNRWSQVRFLHLECHINDNLRRLGKSNESLVAMVTEKMGAENVVHSSIEMCQ